VGLADLGADGTCGGWHAWGIALRLERAATASQADPQWVEVRDKPDSICFVVAVTNTSDSRSRRAQRSDSMSPPPKRAGAARCGKRDHSVTHPRRGTPTVTATRDFVRENRIRVCHMIHSLGAGGAEQALLELARVAPDAGLTLSVLSLVRAPYGRYARDLHAAGAEVVELNLPARWDARVFAKSFAAACRLDPMVVHTHLKHADLAGSYVAQRLNVPMVSTLHVIEDAPTCRGRVKRRLAAEVRNRSASLTIAVSEALRRWYLRTFHVPPARVVTVHNGIAAPAAISPEHRGRVRAELSVPESKVLVAMVAIMRPGKGHAQLIEAARRIPDGSPVHLLLIGDGPLRRRLQAAAHGLPCPVTFTGFRTDVPALLAASDLVVHTPEADALPTALLEALATGRPVVATNVGGIGEIVTPESGRLVRPGDISALVRNIVELAADSEARRQLGTGARARFEQEFDAHLWASRLHGCYSEILRGFR
jgi:glycosyltransferase involved in cell wall biosynthesis